MKISVISAVTLILLSLPAISQAAQYKCLGGGGMGNVNSIYVDANTYQEAQKIAHEQNYTGLCIAVSEPGSKCIAEGGVCGAITGSVNCCEGSCQGSGSYGRCSN